MPGMEFPVRAAAEFGGPAVFVMSVENAWELPAHARPLGFDLDPPVAQKWIVLDHVQIEHSGALHRK